MRAIATDFFQQSPFMAGPLVAMLIFLGIFLVVLARLWIRGSRSYEEAAQLPLLDDDAASAEREVSR